MMAKAPGTLQAAFRRGGDSCTPTPENTLDDVSPAGVSSSNTSSRSALEHSLVGP